MSSELGTRPEASRLVSLGEQGDERPKEERQQQQQQQRPDPEEARPARPEAIDEPPKDEGEKRSKEEGARVGTASKREGAKEEEGGGERERERPRAPVTDSGARPHHPPNNHKRIIGDRLMRRITPIPPKRPPPHTVRQDEYNILRVHRSSLSRSKPALVIELDDVAAEERVDAGLYRDRQALEADIVKRLVVGTVKHWGPPGLVFNGRPEDLARVYARIDGKDVKAFGTNDGAWTTLGQVWWVEGLKTDDAYFALDLADLHWL